MLPENESPISNHKKMNAADSQEEILSDELLSEASGGMRGDHLTRVSDVMRGDPPTFWPSCAWCSIRDRCTMACSDGNGH